MAMDRQHLLVWSCGTPRPGHTETGPPLFQAIAKLPVMTLGTVMMLIATPDHLVLVKPAVPEVLQRRGEGAATCTCIVAQQQLSPGFLLHTELAEGLIHMALDSQPLSSVPGLLSC